MSTEPAQPEQQEISKINLIVPKSMHVDLKIRAIHEDKTLQELVFEAVSLYMNQKKEAA